MHKIEYLDQPKPSKPKPPIQKKKGWGKSLITGLLVATVAVGAALMVNKTSCERRADSATDASGRRQEERKKVRQERLKRLEHIKQLIKARKEFIEKNPGWSKSQSDKDEESYSREEKEFRADLEDMDKGQLMNLLVEQRKKIIELREEYDGDDSEGARMELAHEEVKRGDIEERLDEIEIEERGYLGFTSEQLEGMIAELDKIIAEVEGGYFPFASEEYMDAVRDRMLVVKALGERAIWDEIFPPA